MKYFIALTSLLGLLTVQAAEVDFSKAYLINSAESDISLNIAGIQTTDQISDEVTNWKLFLGFNPDDATFSVLNSTTQDNFDAELAQQRLRGTIWHGDYTTANSLYDTELHIKAVQAGFVGAEVIHHTLDEPEPSNFLHVKLIGDISSQYLIDKDQEDDLDWVYIDEYEQIVAEINDETKDSESDSVPEILAIRHLMRLKRGQQIENPKHATSSWGTFNEYRLTVENNRMIGSVGKPSERYNDKDTLTGNGRMDLIMTGVPFPILD